MYTKETIVSAYMFTADVVAAMQYETQHNQHTTQLNTRLKKMKNNIRQNYWVSGLCPLSIIPNAREKKVLKTGSVPVLR
jgi:hypothetical protein